VERSLKYTLSLFLILSIPFLCPADIVLNEIMYNPLAGNSGEQWIELYNDSGRSISLQGWEIQTAGDSFQTILSLPNLIIAPYGFILIAGEYVPGADLYTLLELPSPVDNTVGIRLISPAGYTDTVLYGENNLNNLPDDISHPGVSFASDTPAGYSLARIEDGYDTNNSAKDWFACSMPSPGYSNIYPVDLILEELEITEFEESLRISVKIINPSSVTIPEAEAAIHIFLNYELQGIFPLPELLPEYHTTEHYHFTELKEGYYPLDIRLVYQNDPDLSNNKLQNAFIFGPSPLILNELLFKESAENQEWLEIYNRSKVPLVMNNFYLEDAAETRTEFSGTIEPESYLIICRDREEFLKYYHYVGVKNVIESISWAVLNNDREELLLADSYGNIFDYTEYTAPASYPYNVSLERVNPYDDQSLWDRCIHSNLSTPAAPNSLLPFPYDLALENAETTIINDRLQHRLCIENTGYHYIEECQLICLAFYNEEAEGTLLYEEHLFLPASSHYEFETEIPTTEYTTFQYLIEAEEDLDPSNDFAFSYYNNDALPVAVNEIMFRPFTDEPRWIELKVNHFYKYLFSVTLETERYSVDIPLTGQEYILLVNNPADSLFIVETYQPEDALIVTGLVSIYVSGEMLTLYDPAENIFEQFSYSPKWSENRGVSAERINPLLPSRDDNWACSIHPAGSTPGKENSIYTPYIPSQVALSLSPNPFSPVQGERTIISFELPEKLSRVNCRIFDLKGRMVNRLADQEISAARGSLIWDGRREDGKILPVGVYIILLEATGSDSERIFRKQDTVVIGH